MQKSKKLRTSIFAWCRRGSSNVSIRKIHGLQFIYSNGTKKFLTGTRKKAHFYLLGEIRKGDKLCISEGYSTAATVHEATHLSVAVAFDAGNLKPVAEAFRNKFPDLKIVICGDDDFGKPINTGRQEAEKAAQAIQGIAVFPTDWRLFNDRF